MPEGTPEGVCGWKKALREDYLYSAHLEFHGAVMSCFFFNIPPTTDIYTLSLHDALPISGGNQRRAGDHFLFFACAAADAVALKIRRHHPAGHGRHLGPAETHRRWHRVVPGGARALGSQDRKSTRLNSSHMSISYAVFCLK